MSLQALIPIVLKASVWLSVFAIGLQASGQDATYLFRRPRELFRALLAMNVLMPMCAIALVYLLEPEPAVRVALVALSVAPIPPLLPKKIVKKGGGGSYGIGLLIAIGLLSIIFVPLAMEMLERFLQVPLKMSVVSIASLIFFTTLLPLGLGIGAHHFAPVLSERLAGPIARVAGVGLLACVVLILIAAAPAVWSLVNAATLVAIAAFVLVGLVIGHVLGGPQMENRTALAISTASRHPGIAIALAVANFPGQKLAMAAVLLYLVINAVISIPYHVWTGRRAKSIEASAPVVR